MNCVFADQPFNLDIKSAVHIRDMSSDKSFVEGSIHTSGQALIRLDWLTVSISDGVHRVCITHKEFQAEIGNRVSLFRMKL